MATPRYLVGIDLGTTNIVVAYCEITQQLKDSPISIFEIDQLIAPGEVSRKPLLPSFRFHPAQGQVSQSDMILPWENQRVEGDVDFAIIGEWARELGAKVEGRQVSSAKSWLSHQSVDRESDILPWVASQDVDKVSPLVATASYLNHVKQAWNYHNPINVLENQEVVITVPASFDESARKLTVKAAKLAGLTNVVLLEEPQAVCYDWYARHADSANTELQEIPLILVCDVGGGTTDLSLIEAKFNNSELALNRIGVGEHLMLGGDNLDLALAHLAEQRFSNQKKLNASSLSKLIQQTRKAKESLLSRNDQQQVKITMLGSGSRLIGGTKSVDLSKQEVHQIVLEGFFPSSSLTDLPDKRRSAVIEFGLPYVADPAVTKHIAEFITQHQSVAKNALGWQVDNSKQNDGSVHDLKAEQPIVPAGLLLNGGVFNSELVTDKLTDILTQWRGAPVTVLDNPHPDLAVALGAVAFAKARRGAQLKIGGGSARSYFLHLAEKKGFGNALCLLAKGIEEGQEIRLSGRRFSLTLDEPVRFNLLTSIHNVLTDNKPPTNGAIYAVNTDIFTPLPPYITTLDSTETQKNNTELHANQKQRVEVQLACKLTEVGTLQLECVSIENDQQRWAVEFEVRKQQASEQEPDSLSPNLQSALDLISVIYSGNKKSADPKAIKMLVKQLEHKLGKRAEWDFSISRQLFDAFAKGRKRRRRSEQHERNWLRLSGYALRPGFGDPTDTWRIEQVWGLYPQGIQYQNHQGWSDWWVFWRRIAGGLNKQQQETIATDIVKYLHPGSLRNPKVAKEAQEKSYEAMVRLAASLEHLDVEDKTLMAKWFMNKAVNESQFAQAHWWALGRLAARQLMYGSQHSVLPREQVEHWLPTLLEQNWIKEPIIAFSAVMMCRKTGDRLFDISDDIRTKVIEKLHKSRSPKAWLELVQQVKQMDETESKRAFGDALPHGLHLVQD
ncbi:Hsp70 family protein [Vibrio sp. TH_r3]|uniref:Hsp70 family protein n=1 Tax=Vibrio sp. TH_r3 TaxID=3082084 RepID=UPI0029537AB6|nr:Hsp70 family protein [Vibrio sp. TH_r3]MDV7103769.1 Hsp70 family protein [Vibrio sp. TH_r3]